MAGMTGVEDIGGKVSETCDGIPLDDLRLEPFASKYRDHP